MFLFRLMMLLPDCFRPFVGILSAVFSRRSPLRLRQTDSPSVRQPNKISTVSDDRLGLSLCWMKELPMVGTHATKHWYESYQPLVHAVPTNGTILFVRCLDGVSCWQVICRTMNQVGLEEKEEEEVNQPQFGLRPALFSPDYSPQRFFRPGFRSKNHCFTPIGLEK